MGFKDFSSPVLGNSSCLCCCLLTLKIYFFKKKFKNTIRVSNSLDLDPDSVSPDLGPNCLQRLSADDKLPLARREFI